MRLLLLFAVAIAAHASSVVCYNIHTEGEGDHSEGLKCYFTDPPSSTVTITLTATVGGQSRSYTRTIPTDVHGNPLFPMPMDLDNPPEITKVTLAFAGGPTYPIASLESGHPVTLTAGR